MRNFLDDSIVEHKSKPPLRWIANWAGSIASHAILKICYLEEDGITTGFKYKLYGFLYDTFWPLYRDYGTTYRLNMDLSGKSWDDYDENGIPYWDKTGTIDPDYYQPWDYEDSNGDAFRMIKQDKPKAACYFCSGTGIMQSDEECFCFNGACSCKNCKD